MSNSQRRTLSKSGSGSFYIPEESNEKKLANERDHQHDIEKLIDGPKPKSSRVLYVILLIVCTTFIGGSLVSLSNKAQAIQDASTPSPVSAHSKFQTDENGLMNTAMKSSDSSNKADMYAADEERSSGWFSKVYTYWVKNEQDGGNTILTDPHDLSGEKIAAGNSGIGKGGAKAITDEDLSLEGITRPNAEVNNAIHPGKNGDQRLKSSTSATANSYASSISVDPQMDLKEILSVAPMTVLLNHNPSRSSMNSKEKERIVSTIINNLSITPEPKVVKLIKHPHYDQIVQYLRTYQTHMKDASDGESDVEEVVAVEEIPAMFIGGLPVGNYDEIIEMYNNKELISFLRKTGKGLITVD